MVGSHFLGAAVTRDVPLAPLTTLRIGPVAARLITCDTTDKVIDVLRALPVDDSHLVLAGGSNVVIADDMTDLTVVHLANTEIEVHGDSGNIVRAEAGALWDDVVVTSLAHDLGGLECLSGIPGTAGATPVQNVGAYGAEVADTIKRVRLLDRRTGEDRWAPPDALGFGYRTSMLKNSADVVVLEVEFALAADGLSAPVRYGELAKVIAAEPGSRIPPTRVRDAVLALRRGKGMVVDDDPDNPDHDTWSVGSFFTNPVVSQAEFDSLATDVDGPVPNYPAPDGVKLAAGWLVEHAGFGRGYPGDGAAARLSTKHALAVTNRGDATTADVIALARAVRDGVEAAFGIHLTPEPILIGCQL